MLEAYEAMPVFIPVDIKEEVVKSVARKPAGGAGPGGTDSEALQGWLLKFGYHSKTLFISVESFVDWLVNQNPPWAAYHKFMSVYLILLDTLPIVRPVRVRETWRCLFLCVLKLMGSDPTYPCRGDHLCNGFKAEIGGAVHRVQYILGYNSTKGDRVFYLLT